MFKSSSNYAHLDLPYYHFLDKESAEKILQDKSDGTFLLHDPSVKPLEGIYIEISLINNNKITHELICIYTGYLAQPEPNTKVITGFIGDYLAREPIYKTPLYQTSSEDYKIQLEKNSNSTTTLLTTFDWHKQQSAYANCKYTELPYYFNIPTNKAEETLKNQPEGTFLLRPSSSKPDSVVTSFVRKNVVEHLLIEKKQLEKNPEQVITKIPALKYPLIKTAPTINNELTTSPILR